jgi:hypothetical protein
MSKRHLSGPIMTPQRRGVIKVLQDLGGEVVDDSGRAWTELRNLTVQEFPQLDLGIRSSLPLAMQKDGIINREMNGKRCYRVALTPLFRDYDTTQPPPWVNSSFKVVHMKQVTVGPGGTERWSRGHLATNGRTSHRRPPEAHTTTTVDLTETEEETAPVAPSVDHYTGLARVLLAEVLDLKVELVKKLREVDVRDAEEVESYKLVNAELKREVAHLQEACEQKGEALKETREKLTLAEQNNTQLIERVNQLEFQLKQARSRIRSQISPDNPTYPITELTEGGRTAWQDLERMLKEPPTTSGEED